MPERQGKRDDEAADQGTEPAEDPLPILPAQRQQKVAIVEGQEVLAMTWLTAIQSALTAGTLPALES